MIVAKCVRMVFFSTMAFWIIGPFAAFGPTALGQEKPPEKTGPSTKAATKPADAKNEKKDGDAEKTSAKKGAGKSLSDEEPVVTRHTIVLDGQKLAYTATAALMPIRNDKGDVEAHIFYTAYTRDPEDGKKPKAAERPLLFSFNGGPGSASVWLHLGALGPKRVETPEGPTIPAPPYRLIDNDATWLDRADLVFIDPVGTGYSRAVKPELNKKFHSLHGDIESVGEFVRMYLARNERWASPLYLIGESYGTTRAAGLAGHLVEQGIAFNGVILVSCALDYRGFVFDGGNDLPYLTYLPSYAATAWYHHKLPADLQQAPLSAVLSEVERWADRDYASILARGDRLSDAEKADAAAKLARYTGLNAAVISDNNLRIDLGEFRRRLLEPAHRSIGRFDGRYRAIEDRGPRAAPSFDASYAAVRPSYTSAFYQYMRGELNFKSDSPYYVLGGGVGRWDFQTGDMGYPETVRSLRDALVKNPHMKIMIASGHYDLATPYRAVEHAIARLGLDPAVRPNITVETYDAGHMMYLDGPSLHKLKRDGAAFIGRALAK